MRSFRLLTALYLVIALFPTAVAVGAIPVRGARPLAVGGVLGLAVAAVPWHFALDHLLVILGTTGCHRAGFEPVALRSLAASGVGCVLLGAGIAALVAVGARGRDVPTPASVIVAFAAVAGAGWLWLEISRASLELAFACM
jgi:hypothetical protein